MQQNYDMQKLMQLARSPAGQRLMQTLKRSGSGQVEKAISLAQTGDMEQAKNTLSEVLKSPDIQQLLQQLEGQL